MAKVPRNKGSYSVYKDGRAQIKFPLGFNEKTGKYGVYNENFPSEAEAIAAIKEINDFIYHGGTAAEVPAHRMKKDAKAKEEAELFRAFAANFVADREKQKTVTERTIKDYRTHLKRIDPYIGSMPISAIGPKDINVMYSGLRSNDRRNGGAAPVSGTYLQHIHSTLSLVFDRAVVYGYIGSNPCKDVDKPKRDTEEKYALSVDECRAFIASVLDKGLEAKSVGLLICLCTAARLSEMLALTWADYSSGTLRISKAMKKDSQETKETKTGDVRNDPCPPILVDVLAEWKELQAAQLERVGLSQTGSTPIVQARRGKHTLKTSFEKWFRLQKHNYNLPPEITIHGLRHTATSILQRDCHVDMATTMQITGHKTVEMLKRYSHTDDSAKRAAAEAFGDLLAPDKNEARCRYCRYWTVSPDDAGIGACWHGYDGNGIKVLPGATKCPTNGFRAG